MKRFPIFIFISLLVISLAGCGGDSGGLGSSSVGSGTPPAAGRIDTASFNSSGTPQGEVITDADYLDTNHMSYVYGLAVQSDGKIIAVGKVGSGWTDAAVARYNTDGSLDAANFNNGGTIPGVVNTNFNEHSGAGADANAVAIDTNGNILVAGGANDNFGNWYFAIARYKPDGTLDTSFNNAGGQPGTRMTQITTAAQWEDRASAVAIQKNGMIVAAGYSSDQNVTHRVIAVVRYKADGSGLDTNFGTNGIVTQTVGSGGSYASAIAIQSDGTIVIGGVSKFTTNAFAILRLKGTDGSLLSTAHTNIGTIDDGIAALALLSNDTIVAAGYSESPTQYAFAVARYKSDGSGLDTSFNSAGTLPGTVTTDVGSNDAATSVALDTSGRIVAAGYSDNGSIFEFALVRYNANGSLDTSFGTGGKVTTAVGTTRSMASAIVLQGDGKIVAGGFSRNGAGTQDYYTLVRYWP